jgi:hypothetical protein
MEALPFELHTMPPLDRDNLQQYVGQSIVTSSIKVAQSRICAFAECTGRPARASADDYHPRLSFLVLPHRP